MLVHYITSSIGSQVLELNAANICSLMNVIHRMVTFDTSSSMPELLAILTCDTVMHWPPMFLLLARY